MTEDERFAAIFCMVSCRPVPAKEAVTYRAVVAFQIEPKWGVPFGWWQMADKFVVKWQGKKQ